MTNSTTEANTRRIYVACLTAYNNGHLHGVWIDADQDAWAMFDHIAAMLKTSPVEGAEEFAIHDYEGFEGIRIAESQGLEEVAALAAFVTEHGKLGAELVNYFGEIDEAREAMEDRYHGAFASLAEYVQEITEGSEAIPERLRYYIDWQTMARDAEMSGDVLTIETAYDEIHVFAGR